MLRRARRPAAALAVALLVLGTAACSSDDDASDDASTDDTSADGSSTTAAPGSTSSTLPLPSLPAAPAAADATDQTPPSGSNGIAIDDDGMLWIADGTGNQVIQVDPAEGAIVSRWPAPDGAWPDDVAIDDAGRVFWTGFQSGEVGRIDPSTGEHVIVAEVAPNANPITFTDDGRLFVGLAVTADGLYEVDPVGRDAPRLLNDELGNVNGFDVAMDGMLYGPRANGEIVRIDWEAGTVLDVVADGFGIPVAVKEGPDGYLYVLSNTPSPTISRVDVATGEVTEVAALTLPGSLADNFAIDREGTFYVTTFDQPTLVVVSTGQDGTVSTELPLGTAP
jgi:sugar lactone lactonase YvrE